MQNLFRKGFILAFVYRFHNCKHSSCELGFGKCYSDMNLESSECLNLVFILGCVCIREGSSETESVGIVCGCFKKS